MNITISTFDGAILARSTQADLESGRVVNVEGNWYFDLSLVDQTYLKMDGAGHNYHCPIKNAWCDYYLFSSGAETIKEIAWIYPKVENSMFVKINGKMAFWKGKVTEKIED